VRAKVMRGREFAAGRDRLSINLSKNLLIILRLFSHLSPLALSFRRRVAPAPRDSELS